MWDFGNIIYPYNYKSMLMLNIYIPKKFLGCNNKEDSIYNGQLILNFPKRTFVPFFVLLGRGMV